MPPLKSGLVNQKALKVELTKFGKATTGNSENSDSDEGNLLGEFGDQLGDSTDSEGEAGIESVGEQEEVLFGAEDLEEDDELEFETDEDDKDDNTDEDNSDSSEEELSDEDNESGIDSDEHPDNTITPKKQIEKENTEIKLQKVNKKLTTEKNTNAIRNGIKKKDEKDKSSASNKSGKIKRSTERKKMAKDQIDNEAQDKDEYETDSSDEEDKRNTVGDIPMWWYNDYPHIGYNLDGKKILKPPQRDQIEEFLKRCEDPEFWRTVKDPQTGQDVILSEEDLDLIARIKSGQVPNREHNEYEPWVEWFTSEVLKTPVRAFPEHKRSFLPSEMEKKKISKLVHALKMGWIKTRRQEWEERKKKKEIQFYNLWGSEDSEESKMRGIHKHIPAPKRPLPGHAESYNPPSEYLLDKLELKQWNKLKTEPWKRKYTFLPQKFPSLREVPAYERYIRERFLRCLDLYLAPRAIKMRLTIDPQDLVPKLPSPRDLQPFPTSESLVFRGHTDMVRTIDTDPSGQYLVSGSDDCSVKVWEISTGRCLKTFKLGGTIRCVSWIPVLGLSLLAVACDKKVLLINPGVGIGDHKIAEKTDLLLEEPPPNIENLQVDQRIKTATQWEQVSPEDWARGIRVVINHFKDVTHLHWHGKGDYLCVTLPDGASRSVIVHQLSRRRSQLPFSKAKGLVQCALFHPVRPFLFVATQRVVRVYDLVKQELVKKLLSGAQWISKMAVHPAGDNLLVGTYDRKMLWFDLDLSTKPYQILRLHGSAVRSVAFHKRYPLFASGSDDKKIIVSHGMVYNDLLQNPLIVPLKQLYGHEEKNDFCILDVKFHPLQPWVISSGADSTIRLYT